MKTNAVFCKISHAFALSPSQLQHIFALKDIELSDKDIAKLLIEHPYAPQFEVIPDYVLALFLEGLIEFKRGKKPDEEPFTVDKHRKLTTNEALKKLRVAFNLQEQDLRSALKLMTIELTKSDFSALFRKPGHAQYKVCDDDLLLDFIAGIGSLLATKNAN
jgi:uncharacterized protein YehS (DUF1456 family)